MVRSAAIARTAETACRKPIEGFPVCARLRFAQSLRTMLLQIMVRLY
jgi:hypothetical protein